MLYVRRVKDLPDFAGIKDVLSQARIRNIPSFVGIKDLLGFTLLESLIS